LFKLEIDTENAAFEDPSEVPRMLEEIAIKIQAGQMNGKVKDINGNTCGEWSF
jgi:hypothetical protein